MRHGWWNSSPRSYVTSCEAMLWFSGWLRIDCHGWECLRSGPGWVLGGLSFPFLSCLPASYLYLVGDRIELNTEWNDLPRLWYHQAKQLNLYNCILGLDDSGHGALKYYTINQLNILIIIFKVHITGESKGVKLSPVGITNIFYLSWERPEETRSTQ